MCLLKISVIKNIALTESVVKNIYFALIRSHTKFVVGSEIKSATNIR